MSECDCAAGKAEQVRDLVKARIVDDIKNLANRVMIQGAIMEDAGLFCGNPDCDEKLFGIFEDVANAYSLAIAKAPGPRIQYEYETSN